MIHFGFSYVGLIFLLMLFIPNGIWTKNQPKDYEKYAKNENIILGAFERIGQVFTTMLCLIFSDFNVRFTSYWTVWFILAALLMIIYEGFWIRYFKSEKRMEDYYVSCCGIPLAGATCPVIAFLFLGIYGCNSFLIMAAIVLGIGHIGIHYQHYKSIKPEKEEKKKPLFLKILSGIGIGFVVIVLALILITISFRNIIFIKGAITGKNGIDEEGYIELGGQKQYYMVRGEDDNNPVIIWLHGGPGSPDTMELYYISNYLKDDYTVIGWNERGCGRTYFKNRKLDPKNETATINQLQSDIDELVDYACERFHQDRIILVGHSFGTMLGSQYASDHPDKVLAYVGVGQMGDLGSELYAYHDALKKAQEAGDDTQKFAEAIIEYQAEETVQNMMKVRSFAEKYHQPKYKKNYVLDAYISPYMGVDDIRWYLLQMDLDKFVSINQNLMDAITIESVFDYDMNFDMPVGFISGSDDWVTPVDYMIHYCEEIKAPVKKVELIDGWGHTVPQENPQEFAKVLEEMLDDLLK